MNVFSIVVFWFVFHLVCTEGYCIFIIQNIFAKEIHNGPNHSVTSKAEPNVFFFWQVFHCCRKNQQLPKIVKDVLMLCTVYIVPFDMAKTKSSLDEYRMRLMSNSWHFETNYLIWQLVIVPQKKVDDKEIMPKCWLSNLLHMSERNRWHLFQINNVSLFNTSE